MRPTVLTVAGSDSSGGAGIQADLKAIAACGGYGASVITALTAQNTCGVRAAEPVGPGMVRAQLDAVFDDLDVRAVKTGMLATAENVAVVAELAAAGRLPNLVVDPVMIAKGGDRLLREDAVSAIKAHLLPLAEVLTPNIPEAEVLAGGRIETLDDMRSAGRRIRAMGPRVVVVKGGHLGREVSGDQVVDVVCAADGEFELRGPRIETRHTHGTGCTFASATAAQLARGVDVETALRTAREYLEGAIRQAPGLGAGHGPLNHFWRVY